jgi:hypothetical protein
VALTIDSSENVLVGKTSTAFGTAGIEARSGGTLWATASGTNAASFNRLSSDGVIAYFNKDGTAVGSIVASGGDLLIGTGDTGIRFVDAEDTFVPFNTNGSGRDNAISIGKSSERFKDLYLSGGVYLGGTAAANKLDDYEEGTWTAVDGSGNAYNPGANATYTKIGRIVYINFDISATASTSGHQIAGLPFTASPTSVTANWSVYGGYSTSNADLWGHINASTNVIGMFVGHVSHTLNGRWIGAGFYYTEQ